MGKPAARRTLKSRPRHDIPLTLRREAESRVAAERALPPEPSRESLQRTLHELQVHEIELQMQNEELIRTQFELEARNRFVELFNQAPVAYLVLDPDETVCEANPAAARLFGYDRSKLVGLRLWRLAPPRSRKELRAHLDELRHARRRLDCEIDFADRSGRAFTGHVESEAFPHPEDGRLQFRIAIIDVTARREAERVRRHSEQALVEVSEHEKQRIGADLHDGLGQCLTATEFLGAALRERLAAEYPSLEPECARICAYLREAITQTRAIARGLAPVRLERSGLMDALTELAHRVDGVGAVGCRFECPVPVDVPQAVVANHLYRIAQEAVTNAMRHAAATKIRIRLDGDDAHLTLRVSDDGRGFDPARRKSKTRSLGLELMRHRARALGGKLEIRAGAGRGTVIECRVP